MYSIKAGASDVQRAFRDNAGSQIQKALETLGGGGDTRTIVHALRKRCKKLRGLLKLFRPVFGDYATENAAVREAARLLSGIRDADVLSQTLTTLIESDPERTITLTAMRDRILAGRMPESAVWAQLDSFRLRLLEIAARARDWTIDQAGFAALAPGLRRTYRSARRRMKTALRTLAASDFHNWRKANKNHGFHVQLLRRAAPVVLRPEQDAVGQLSEHLGDHHDLDVLAMTAERTPERFGSTEERRVLRDAIAGRLKVLETEIVDLGRQTLVEAPAALVERYERYWTNAPPAGDEPRAD